MTTFGTYIRDVREAAGISLRELAKRIGVSHVFIGEVERGLSGLPRERWAAMIEQLPQLDVQKMEALDDRRRPVRLNMADKTPKEQEVTVAFARRMESRSLSETELNELIQLLGRGVKRNGHDG